jgi:hypothetical protein
MDAARFYEIYHASRESFLYIRHFYIGVHVLTTVRHCARVLTECSTCPRHRPGEVAPQDRTLVPQPHPGPSADFIEQLKLFTPFRLAVTGACKSF